MSFRFSNILAAFLTVLTGVFGLARDAAAQGGYSIQPGDTLQVEVLEDPTLNRSVLVLPNGSITFPMAGTVRASGRSPDQVAASLRSKMASSFAAPPTVFVSVGSLSVPQAAITPSTMDVYAVGEVNNPGLIPVTRGTTLLQFLAQAGGLTAFAADKRIELHRTDSSGKITSYKFNYRTPAGGPDGISGGTRLSAGDVVKVPQRRLFE
ncbi:MAG: polysaccharide biosynthesis/export family protein [Marinibacterium sp.]